MSKTENVDELPTEEQVESVMAEAAYVDKISEDMQRYEEVMAEEDLDEANFAIQEKAKTMGNTDQNGCRKNVKDVEIFGEDLFKLMAKASSEGEGWMKSTKGMDTGKGCVIQVTTQQRNTDGSYSVAEALTYVSGVTLIDITDEDGNVIGRRLKGVR